MNDGGSPLPENLSDEAAFALSEALHGLAIACDEKYFAQIRRHMATRDNLSLTDSKRPWEQ